MANEIPMGNGPPAEIPMGGGRPAEIPMGTGSPAEIPMGNGPPAEIDMSSGPVDNTPAVTDRTNEYHVPLRGAWQPLITARQQDYTWPEIMGQLSSFQDKASQYGHSQEAADAYLGYNTSALGSRLGGAIMNAVGQEGIHPIEAATDGWVKPTGNPDKPYNITDTPDTVRFDYANALINGEAKGPQDFVDNYLNFAGQVTKTDLSSLKWGLTANLPNPMEAVDYANGIAQMAGNPKSADIALANLIDNWGSTGQPMAQTYAAAAKDPFLRDALVTPQQAAASKPALSTVQLDPEKQRLLNFLGYVNPEFGMVKGFIDALHGDELKGPDLSLEHVGRFIAQGMSAFVKGIPTPEEAERIMAGNGTADEQQRAFLYSTTLGGGGLFHGNVPPPVGVITKALEDGKPGASAEGLTPGSFTTAKGSVYEVHENGTTTRNKSFHPEHGEADQGMQPRSEATIYATAEQAKALSEIQSQGGGGRIIAPLGDGRWGIKYTEGKDAGKFESRTVITPSTEPAKGLTPVETWQGGSRVHFGNEITDVTGKSSPILDAFKQTLADSRGAIMDGVRAPRQPDFGEGAIRPSAMDMRLRRLTGSINAADLHLSNILRDLPDEFRGDAIQKKIGDEVETGLYTPGTQMARSVEGPLKSPETQEYLTHVKKLTDMERELGDRVAEKSGMSSEKFIGVDEGYMHRIWDQKQLASLDPNVAMELTSGTIPPNKLSRYAASMQGRSDSMYVFDHGDGTRVWGKEPLDSLGINEKTSKSGTNGEPYKIGDTIETPDGKTVTITRPTMQEIEANTPNFTGSHNHFVNTLINVSRLQKVDKVLDFVADQAKDLSDRGQFIPNNEAGLPKGVVPQGYVETQVPGLKGFMDPRIANAINDFWQGPGPLLTKLNRVSQWIINPMFLNPVPHSWNMFNGYLLNRAADWINPAGYVTMYRSVSTAIKEIATRGPLYQEHIANGNGLPYSSQAAQNFHNFLAQKTLADMKADTGTWGPIANRIGLGLPDLFARMQSSIHSAMWFAGDVMKFSRELEWRAKGYDLDSARELTEKDMAPYQLPTEMLEHVGNNVPGFYKAGHFLSQVMKQPIFDAFARFHYGLSRSITSFANDITRPLRGDFSVEGQEAYVNAIAKALLAGSIAYYQVPFLYNHGVSKWVDDARQGQWHNLLNSIATMSPVYQIAKTILANKDFFNNDVVKDKAGWQQKVGEATNALAELYYPMQQIAHGVDKGWGKVLDDATGGGFTKQEYTPSPYQQRVAQRAVASEFKNKTIVRGVTKGLGGSDPDNPQLFTPRAKGGGKLKSGY